MKRHGVGLKMNLMLQNIKLRKQEQQCITYRLKTERRMGSFPLLTRADTWLGATS